MKAINSVKYWIDKLCRLILILLFSVMTITYFGQIVLRYVFGTGLPWTEELTRYCQVALIMFGAAVLSGRNLHINVSILESVVPVSYQKWVIIMQQIITAIFFVAAINISFDMIALADTQVSTNLRVPMKFVYGIFPVAYSILVFNVAVFILNQIVTKEVTN